MGKYYIRTAKKVMTVIQIYDSQNNQIDYVEAHGRIIREIQVGKVETTVSEKLREMSDTEVTLMADSGISHDWADPTMRKLMET